MSKNEHNLTDDTFSSKAANGKSYITNGIDNFGEAVIRELADKRTDGSPRRDEDKDADQISAMNDAVMVTEMADERL